MDGRLGRIARMEFYFREYRLDGMANSFGRDGWSTPKCIFSVATAALDSTGLHPFKLTRSRAAAVYAFALMGDAGSLSGGRTYSQQRNYNRYDRHA
jgi:hypothetical protein